MASEEHQWSSSNVEDRDEDDAGTPGTPGAPTLVLVAPPELRERSDALLIEEVLARSRDALGEVYRRYSDAMRSVARRMRGSAEADDVVQDVFVRLWDRPQQFDAQRGSLRSFLIMQTRGRSIDLMRSDASRRAREASDHMGSAALGPPSDIGVLAEADVVDAQALLRSLSADERRSIALAVVGGHTYREVAEILQVPEGTVKSRIRTGLRRLRADVVYLDVADGCVPST